jgi:hypothetical protein
MFDVTTFLIRWLFLSSLARDVAEVQTLPWQPYYPHEHQTHHQQQQQQQQADADTPLPKHRREEQWRDECIRGILSYPPGQQRLFVMDALRIELVQQLARQIQRSTDVAKRASAVAVAAAVATATAATVHKHAVHLRQANAGSDKGPGDSTQQQSGAQATDDPFLDADLEILEALGPSPKDTDETRPVGGGLGASSSHHHSRATLVISGDDASVLDASSDEGSADTATTAQPSGASSNAMLQHSSSENDGAATSDEEVTRARRNLREMKDYLPQLAAAVLRSPPAFDPNLANPVQKLRQVLLKRCSQDPGFGIDLCWLLEAEVGRAWKTLFEHRQQTGRRLIVVLPTEKAAVLAKIGSEKKGAFDLLQDAEQATAYGYAFDSEDRPTAASEWDERHEELVGVSPRLPSSLSLRRCSHFGDTMHFVDRLTKVSLELRVVPHADRLVRTNARTHLRCLRMSCVAK